MKILTSFFVYCFLLPFALHSQTVTVLEKTNMSALQNVLISAKGISKTLVTGARGQAEISSFVNSDSISFSHVGFQTMVISYAQAEKNKWQILMTERIQDLGEIVISSSRFEEKREDVPRQLQVIRASEIRSMNQQTTADMLMQSGNVHVQKSQQGGGSPVLRGFEANKVLMVVDGVRMNNAIYRAGHLQNVITLDQSMIEKAEVVFGPGSVMYGSDALGGVIHFYTKNPVLSDEEGKLFLKSNAFSRFATANNERTGHVDVNFGGKRLASLTSITHSDFSDLRQGNIRNPFYPDFGKRNWYVERTEGGDSIHMNSNSNVQVQSGYWQYDILQKVLFRQEESVSHIFNFQFSTSSDIPRYDRLTQESGNKPRFAEWYYGPQERIFGSYALNLDRDSGMFDKARIIIAGQRIIESRHDRRFRSDFLRNREETVSIFSLNADFSKDIKKHEIRYGAEVNLNDVQSEAYIRNIVADTTTGLDTRYPDGGSAMVSSALYLNHHWELSEKFVLSDGIRFSNVRLRSVFNDSTFFPFPFREVSQDHNAVNGNIGLVVKPCTGWLFMSSLATGFRAPNVDDIGKVFESVPGRIVVPNPHLEPEYTYNAEFGISKSFGGQVIASGNTFYTIYDNIITLSDSKFNGADSIFYDGRLSKVTSQMNKDEAYIYGFNANVTADVTRHFSLYSTINYTYGRVKTDSTDQPLDHIPPVFGKSGVILKLNKFRGEFYSLYNGWKYKKEYSLSGEDNFSNATPHGMPAWMTLNVKASYHLRKYFQVQAGLENILDTNYRVFSSNISAAGRNLVFTLRGTF